MTELIAPRFYGAVGAAAKEIVAPVALPWGWGVSWVRCPAGMLVEPWTPMGW